MRLVKFNAPLHVGFFGATYHFHEDAKTGLPTCDVPDEIARDFMHNLNDVRSEADHLAAVAAREAEAQGALAVVDAKRRAAEEQAAATLPPVQPEEESPAVPRRKGKA